MKTWATIAGALAWAFAAGAQASCTYRGEDNAETTISREFRDAGAVVRARVAGAEDHLSDDGESWTIYQLEVRHAYKGSPPPLLRLFTFRDSGGFYLDRPWEPLPGAHAIGDEYLLFLNPAGSDPGLPDAARGAFVVNYSCGVSGPWNSVSPAQLRELEASSMSGVFSNVAYSEETGDAGGLEVQIDAHAIPPTVVFTICEGGCYGGKTWPITIDGNRISFRVVHEWRGSDGSAWSEAEDYEGVMAGDRLILSSAQLPGVDPYLERVPNPSPGQTARLAGARD